MTKAGIKRLSINQLTPTCTDFLIVGIIIAKRKVKKFSDRKVDGTLRAVCGFTLRDSPADYINVTVWGTATFVDKLVSDFRVGHVVAIINPKVGVRKEGSAAQYEPPVTSFLELVFNELSSEIYRQVEDDSVQFNELLRLPTKPPSYFITIADVKATGKPLDSQFVNLLVAIQKINPRRTVTTRIGESVVQDFEVMDQTSLGFLISTWEQPMIDMISNWQPRDTCLFLADVKMKWSDFNEQMTGVLTGKCIVTENPNTSEAIALSKYASTVATQRTAVVDALAASLINPESITNVLSCGAVLEQALSGTHAESFTALVYGVVESYDLDGFYPVVKVKCSVCGELIKDICSKDSCQLQPTYGLIYATYDIRVTLMDHTNTLENCRLKGTNAAKLLGLKAEDFVQLSNERKIELKWKYLMKKVAARLVILPAKGSPLISIVSMEPVSLTEFSFGFPMC